MGANSIAANALHLNRPEDRAAQAALAGKNASPSLLGNVGPETPDATDQAVRMAQQRRALMLLQGGFSDPGFVSGAGGSVANANVGSYGKSVLGPDGKGS